MNGQVGKKQQRDEFLRARLPIRENEISVFHWPNEECTADRGLAEGKTGGAQVGGFGGRRKGVRDRAKWTRKACGDDWRPDRQNAHHTHIADIRINRQGNKQVTNVPTSQEWYASTTALHVCENHCTHTCARSVVHRQA